MPRPPLRPALLLIATLCAVTGSSEAHAPRHGETIIPPPAVSSPDVLAHLPDAAVETLPGGFAVVVPAAFAPPTPQTDPRYGGRFSRAVWVYAPGAEAGLRRVVTLHFEPENRAQATVSARLVARLLRLHRAHFGGLPPFGGTGEAADVWLAPTHPTDPVIGGETRQNQVYIFAVGAESTTRTPLEWVRTLAHEWGHLTLFAARGYREPENDAAGFLGERLYMKWLHEDTAPPLDDGTRPDDLALYHKRQIAPLIARWLANGPATKSLDGNDTAAMDGYIGAVLASDSAFGSALTGRALNTVLDSRPRDFVRSLARVVNEEVGRVSVRLPAWVPVVRGTYSVASGGGAGTLAWGDGQTTNLAANGAGRTIAIKATGWRHLTVARGDLDRVILRHVERQP